MRNSDFSLYVFKYSLNDNETILFNSYNGSLVVLENKYLLNPETKLDDSQYHEMDSMGFFIPSSTIDELVKDKIQNFKSDQLDVVIEMTRVCNFSCVYCYQKEWPKTQSISNYYLDNVVEYIQNCINKYDYKRVVIAYFGGEPLLEQEKILSTHNRIDKFCKAKGVQHFTKITTNGTLLKKDFLEKFTNIEIMVTLSLKDDHDQKRHFHNIDLDESTYDIIIKNLLDCREYFERDTHDLSLRYNCDNRNIKEFEKFVKLIHDYNLKVTIKTAFTFEHFENDYINTLSIDSYRKWNSSEAIDILIKYNFKIKYQPIINYYPCRAYYKHNLKVYSDGKLGLCDAHPLSMRRSSISEIVDDIDGIFDIFSEKKQNLLLESSCENCKERFLCVGMSFCKSKPCEYGFIDLEEYLKSYVNHALLGNQDFFDF